MAEPSSATFVPGVAPDISENIVNQKSFTVSGSHNSTTTTITVNATISGITAPQYLVNKTTGEIIYAEGISGATFTSCTRGADGSTAAAMTTGELLVPVVSANLYNQLVREVVAIAGYVDEASSVNLHRIAQEKAIASRKSDKAIDHDKLKNTHDLTTDIDHDALTNFSADEHFTQANITALGTVVSGNVDAIIGDLILKAQVFS